MKGVSQWVRSQRIPRFEPDPWEPLRHLWEEEREPTGGAIRALTVFLAGAECPFTCVFCDLWRETLHGPTPVGALPTQLRKAFAAAGPLPARASLKLYNASNFFDPRAVPVADEPALLDLAAPFARVTVECHPRLIENRCLRFAERLEGRLEVAMGLETVHPEALARLNKGLTLDDFDRAAETLRRAGIGMRGLEVGIRLRQEPLDVVRRGLFQRCEPPRVAGRGHSASRNTRSSCRTPEPYESGTRRQFQKSR